MLEIMFPLAVSYGNAWSAAVYDTVWHQDCTDILVTANVYLFYRHLLVAKWHFTV